MGRDEPEQPARDYSEEPAERVTAGLNGNLTGPGFAAISSLISDTLVGSRANYHQFVPLRRKSQVNSLELLVLIKQAFFHRLRFKL